MDISIDIHVKSVDVDMDMDARFHIHGKPGDSATCEVLDVAKFDRLRTRFRALPVAVGAHG